MTAEQRQPGQAGSCSDLSVICRERLEQPVPFSPRPPARRTSSTTPAVSSCGNSRSNLLTGGGQQRQGLARCQHQQVEPTASKLKLGYRPPVHARSCLQPPHPPMAVLEELGLISAVEEVPVVPRLRFILGCLQDVRRGGSGGVAAASRRRQQRR